MTMIRSVVLVMLLLALGAITSAALQLPSSTSLLLSPEGHVGQRYSWLGKSHIRPLTGATSSAIKPNLDLELEYICTLRSINGNGLTLDRKVNTRVGKRLTNRIFPTMKYRAGHGTTLDGHPLNNDPLCLFYSVSNFGSPPPSLALGTAWQFSTTTHFGSVQKTRGEATVVGLNVLDKKVRIHVVMRNPTNGAPELISDILVAEGGIIEQSSESWSFFPTSSSNTAAYESTEKTNWVFQKERP